jgi:gliding motility-associated lipoprotein GldH
MTEALRHTCHLAACAIVLLTLMSCGQRTVLHVYKSVPLEGWEKNDSLIFPVDSLPRTCRYDLSIGLRTASSYPYQEVWLIVDTRLQRPRYEHSDTVRCQLVNAKGDTRGRGVSISQYAFPVDSKYLLRGQRGQIRVHHMMKREILPGISDVGIRMDMAE